MTQATLQQRTNTFDFNNPFVRGVIGNLLSQPEGVSFGEIQGWSSYQKNPDLFEATLLELTQRGALDKTLNGGNFYLKPLGVLGYLAGRHNIPFENPSYI